MIKDYIKFVKSFLCLNCFDKKTLLKEFFIYLFDMFADLFLPIFFAIVIDSLDLGDNKTVYISINVLLLAYMFKILINRFCFVYYKKVTIAGFKKLHFSILNKVNEIEYDFTGNISKSFVVNTVSNDVEVISGMHHNLIFLFSSFIYFLISLIIMFFVNFYLGFLTLVVCFIYFYFDSILTRKKDYFYKKQVGKQDEIVDFYVEMINGQKDVRSMDITNGLVKYFGEMKKNWLGFYNLKRRYFNYKEVNLNLLLNVGLIIFYIILIVLLSESLISLGIFVMLVTYYNKIIIHIVDINYHFNILSANYICLGRVFKILNYVNSEAIVSGSTKLDDITGLIEFKNVHLRYGDIKVLDNLNLKILPNSLTVVTGKIGSGKSSLFRLLMRKYSVTSGGIYIDGVNINNFDSDYYKGIVSLSFQHPYIFDMSIRENLNLVNSDIKLQESVCKKVNLHDYIMEMPLGYDTILTVNDNKFSVGERQLFSIARTLLSGGKILLFDEVLSNLDDDFTKRILDLFFDLAVDHTILVISHKVDVINAIENEIHISEGGVIKY